MRESGQSVVEWLAVCAGVLAFAGVAAVAVPHVAPAITGGMQAQICHVTGGPCDSPPATPPAAARAQVAPPAPAAPAAPTPSQPPATPDHDLCGSSYFNVPELWFNSACANHDRCYGAHRGKAACDTAFLNDMLEICKHVGSTGSSGVNSSLTRASCRAAAHLYYKGVVVGGGPSYCHRAVCREE